MDYESNPSAGAAGIGGAILVGTAVGLVAYLLLRPATAGAAGRASPSVSSTHVPAPKTLGGLYVQTFCQDAITREEVAGAPLRLADVPVLANAGGMAQAAFDAYAVSPLALTSAFRVFATDLPVDDVNAALLALRETRPLFCSRGSDSLVEVKRIEADGTITRTAVVYVPTGVDLDPMVQSVYGSLDTSLPTAVFVRDRANAQRLLAVRSTNGFEGDAVPTAGSGVVVPLGF